MVKVLKVSIFIFCLKLKKFNPIDRCMISHTGWIGVF